MKLFWLHMVVNILRHLMLTYVYVCVCVCVCVCETERDGSGEAPDDSEHGHDAIEDSNTITHVETMGR